MKRQGKLFEQVVDFHNLLAAKKAFRGHKQTLEVARFSFHLEYEHGTMPVKRRLRMAFERNRLCPGRASRAETSLSQTTKARRVW